MVVSNLVLETCESVCREAKRVKINDAAITDAAASLSQESIRQISSESAFDTEIHLVDQGDTTAQYLLVVDALNFCFWPQQGLEYEHLAKGLKASVLANPECISAESLASIGETQVSSLIGQSLPNASERARLLQEVGQVLLTNYGGLAANLIRRADRSALHLVHLLTTQFRGFQDHAIYRGRQIFFYKRAQIFVGDVWGAFKGKDHGEFHDIDQLTMFADYRVPVTLKELNILEYDQELDKKVQSKCTIASGSEEEIEIRASTVVATERLRKAIERLHGSRLLSIQLDWWLWEEGERHRNTHQPHHRTRTIFY